MLGIYGEVSQGLLYVSMWGLFMWGPSACSASKSVLF